MESGSLSKRPFSLIETAHNGLIHDVQPDFFGKWLATCSSDNSIHIYDIKNPEKTKPIATLNGHEGPVYKLSWAHPFYGNILASCSYDKKVIIWKEHLGTWSKAYTHDEHSDSVITLAWSPQDHGLILVCGSMDGCLSLVYCNQNEYLSIKKVVAHQIGVTSVSWGPAFSWKDDECTQIQQFVSSGMDGAIKLWIIEDKKIKFLKKLDSHMDSVRCVAWAPDVGTQSMIASGSQDGSIIVWIRQTMDGNWDAQLLGKLNEAICSVSWSINARTLAVSSGANNITLWKQRMDNTWICVTRSNVGENNINIQQNQSITTQSQPIDENEAHAIQYQQETNNITQI